MARLVVAALLIVGSLCMGVLAQELDPREPTASASFRAGVELVSMNVSVTDREKRGVIGLEQADFIVLEDGAKQDITFFSPRRQPVALSLLLDSSASMEMHLATLQTAATNFVHRLSAADIAQVIDFDSQVQIRQGFTSNQPDLGAAIKAVEVGGSTSLFNALYIALRELQKVRAVVESDVRRQALIVFSDGADTSSLVTLEQVMDLAKRTDASIYTITLRDNTPAITTKNPREAEFAMRALAQETGGRAFFPAKIDDLESVYGQIADELASRYTLGYMPTNPARDGGWRRITVRVARENVLTLTKNGYYAPSAPGRRTAPRPAQ